MRALSATIRLTALLAIPLLAVMAAPASGLAATGEPSGGQSGPPAIEESLTSISLVYQSDVRGKVEPCG